MLQNLLERYWNWPQSDHAPLSTSVFDERFPDTVKKKPAARKRVFDRVCFFGDDKLIDIGQKNTGDSYKRIRRQRYLDEYLDLPSKYLNILEYLL